MPQDFLFDLIKLDTKSLTIIESTAIILFNSIFWLGSVFELLCGILFFYHVLKKTKYFSTAFFYILTIGLCFDIASFFTLFATFFTDFMILISFGIFLSWYSTMILGPWNTLMALNRFTAVWFWKRHETIWNWKLVIGGIAGMFIYPFITCIHLFIKKFDCIIYIGEMEICNQIAKEANFIELISNGVHVIIVACLGIITSCASKFKMISLTSETKKFEQFLLIQSVLSFIIYSCFLYNYFVEDDSDKTVFKQLINVLAGNCYTFFRISSVLLLFILS